MVVIEEVQPFAETREKLEMNRVKFLRIARRLGQMPCNIVVAQVLYRLGLIDPLTHKGDDDDDAWNKNIIDRATLMAEQLEAAKAPLDFSCTILVLGKTGVGKSATINSIFDEEKLSTNAYKRCTREIQEVVGTVEGIKIRVIDTPGLLPHWSDQQHNRRILTSVKHFIEKTPPDVVLYVDRLDLQSTGCSDGPLLRNITDVLGASIWCNKAIIVITHAASSALADGPNGTSSSYDMFVAWQSHAVLQAIREAAGDVRLSLPVSLVENNHYLSACETKGGGAYVSHFKKMWRPHLLLLSFASKILVEATTCTKLQDAPRRPPFAMRLKVYSSSSLYKSLSNPACFCDHHKVVCDPESESEVRIVQDLLETRLVLATDEMSYVLPDSFNSENPRHRYRQPDFYLKTVGSSRWQLKPVDVSSVWDDEVCKGGIDAVISHIADQKVHGWLHSQVLKDKKHAFLKMESFNEIEHGGGTVTQLMCDVDYIKSTDKQGLLYRGGRWKDVLSCKLKTDTRVMNHGRHKANAGLMFGVDGNEVLGGVAVGDEIFAANDQFNMRVSGCAVATPSDGLATGGNLTGIFKWSGSALVRLWLQFVPGVARNLGDCWSVDSTIPAGRDSMMQLYVCSRVICIYSRTSKYPQVAALLLLIPTVRRLLRRAKQLVM